MQPFTSATSGGTVKPLYMLLTGIREAAKALCVLLFIYIVFAILLQVFGRYFANYVDLSIEWTEESARFAQVWLILLGSGIAMRERMHVSVDILLKLLPQSIQKIMVALTSVMAFGFLYIAITHSFRLIRIGAMQTSPALDLPMHWVFLALPVGLGYFALEFAIATILRLREKGENI